MISIDKTKIKKPDILDNTWIQKRLNKIKNEDKPGKKIKQYNAPEVKDALNELYNNKCAYCEGIANSAKFKSRIDHFRPKNGIKEIENHKGYFWLGYEWTNLLPTCETCNREKWNKFPLEKGKEDTRISDDLVKEGFIKNNEFIFENFKIENLEREKRLLLNPEIDQVEKYLYFLPTGEIKHLLTDKGEKLGKKSIEVYNLNRKSLISERKTIIDNLYKEIIDIFIRDTDNFNNRLKEFFDKKIRTTNDLEYSRFRFFIYHFFDFFIINKFKDTKFNKLAKILSEQYKEYRKK